VETPSTSDSRKEASTRKALRSASSALAAGVAPIRLGEKACSTARWLPPWARKSVFSSTSCTWLPMRRNSAIASGPIWLA
jgi:hypothetical protein